MNARDAILQRVSNACGNAATTDDNINPASDSYADVLSRMPDDVQQRLRNPSPATQPAVPEQLIDALIAKMESVQMSVVRLQSANDVVSAVDWYLQEQGIDGAVTVSPSLEYLDWDNSVAIGAASGAEATSVTSAFAAVAETGSIAFASSGQTPATLNFLPENHLVVLHESQIVEHLEDVWTQLRSEPELPRALSLVTGPSRTGDIEQTIELGAHGPRRMHVMLIAGAQKP